MSKIGVKIWRWLFETGDERRLANLMQDLSDLEIKRDIPYLEDGDRGHLLDLYLLPETGIDAPVMINIHGGGLFASYKEVNANFSVTHFCKQKSLRNVPKYSSVLPLRVPVVWR